MVDLPDRRAVELELTPAWARALTWRSLHVDDGWLSIVLAVHRRLEAIDPGYRIAYIEQRYGELRFAFSPSKDVTPDDVGAMHRIVRDAARGSLATCEECGRAGRLLLIIDYWTVRCTDHAARR